MEKGIIITQESPVICKGFISKEGQKVLVKCPECEELNEIQLGQGRADNCIKCNYELGKIYDTFELFESTDVHFVYSDIKFVIPFMLDKGDNKLNSDLNNNRELSINASKVFGETFFETIWDINESYSIYKFLIEDDEEACILINKSDDNALLHLSITQCPLDKVYIIDENQIINKLNKIEVAIKIF